MHSQPPQRLPYVFMFCMPLLCIVFTAYVLDVNTEQYRARPILSKHTSLSCVCTPTACVQSGLSLPTLVNNISQEKTSLESGITDCADTLSLEAQSLVYSIAQEESDIGVVGNHPIKTHILMHPNASEPPSTTLQCKDEDGQFPVCALQNLYYHHNTNAYVSLRGQDNVKDFLMSLSGSRDTFTNAVELQSPPDVYVEQLAILASIPHPNYCHGFLEDLSCLFWEITLMQGRSYGINPDRIVFWISRSTLFDEFPHNLGSLVFDDNMAIQYTSEWRKELHRIFSSYSIGFSAHPSLKNKVVHFKRIIIPRYCAQRSIFINRHGLHDPVRSFKYTPFTSKVYGRWMLLFGDYILRRFGLPSKFTNASSLPSSILISPRSGAGKREILNPVDLLQSLQSRFHEPSSMQDFGSMYDTMQILGTTRLLISPHGAGLSNIVFMRIGTTVLETDSYLCDFQGDFYGELARSVSVNHRVWAEKQPPQPRSSCDFQAFVLLDVGAVCSEVSELLKEGLFFRDAHVKQAVTRVLSGSNN